MPAPATPLTPDPALLDALAELTRHGLDVARLVANYANTENAALNDLKQAAAQAKQAMVDPPNLAAAIQAGQDADACEAALKEIGPRIVLVTDCIDKVGRTVRRTLALHARIASGRPFGRAPSHTAPGHPAHPAHPPRPARPPSDAERPEPLDRPELGQELDQALDAELDRDLGQDLNGEPGAPATQPAVGTVHHDLSRTTTKAIRLAKQGDADQPGPADILPPPPSVPRPASPAVASPADPAPPPGPPPPATTRRHPPDT